MARLADDFPHGQQLIDAGFTTTLKVQKASDEELLAIEGIGPAELAAIRAASVEPAEDEAADDAPAEEVPVARRCSNPTCGYEITTSPCPYCGTV